MNGKGRLSAVSSVYGRVARDYYLAEWQPLPLPRGAKKSPPSGYTGDGAKQVTHVDLDRWLRDPATSVGNIGLHLLHPFVGIDIDTRPPGGNGAVPKRGIETIRRAEAELGPLPPTLISTARALPEGGGLPCTESGIRVYRLPGRLGDDGKYHLWPQSWPVVPRAEQALEPWGYDVEVAGKVRRLTGVDVISPLYRYMVVWPSTNPDADGAEYRWWLPMGDARDANDYVVLDTVPVLGMIADLPPSWAELLTGRIDPRPDSGVPRTGRGAPTLSPADSRNPVHHPVRTHEDISAFGGVLPDGMAVADPLQRPWTTAAATARIDEALAELVHTPHGQINGQLRDTAAALGHFVPEFLTAAQFRDELLAAHRRARVNNGLSEHHDHDEALVTIDRTLPYLDRLRAARDPEGWIAIRDETDEPNDDATNVDDEDESPFVGSAPRSVTTTPSPMASPDRSGSTPAEVGADVEGDPFAGLLGADIEDDPEYQALLVAEQARVMAKAACGEDTPEGKLARRLARHAEAEKAKRAERAADHADWLEDRAEGERMFAERAEARAEAEAPARLAEWRAARIRNLDQLRERPAIPWQVKGWVPAGSTGMIFADEGIGKTFWLIDMAVCVAVGRPWHGCDVRPGKIMVVAGEGEDDISERLEAWITYHSEPERTTPLSVEEIELIRQNLLIHDGPLQIMDDDDLAVLRCMIEEERIVMVIFDTQSACTEGYDENDNTAMRDMISRLRKIAIREPHPVMCTVGHPGHSSLTKDRPRGAKVQLANNDFLIRLDRPEESMEITFRHRKLKRGSKLGPEHVKLAPSADSLTIVHVDASDKRPPRVDVVTAAKGVVAEIAKRYEPDLADLVLYLLRDSFYYVGGATVSVLAKAINDLRKDRHLVDRVSGQPGKPLASNDRALYRVLSQLCKPRSDDPDALPEEIEGLVKQDGSRYAITASGCRAKGWPVDGDLPTPDVVAAILDRQAEEARQAAQEIDFETFARELSDDETDDENTDDHAV